MTTDYCKLDWVVTPTAASVPDVVSLFEQFIISPGTLYAAIDLANALFSIPVKISTSSLHTTGNARDISSLF